MKAARDEKTRTATIGDEAADVGLGAGASAAMATPAREITARTAMRKRALDPVAAI